MHSKKRFVLISFIESGIIIFSKLIQNEKEPLPMISTELGISIFFNFQHPSNTSSPISLMLFGKITSSKFLHREKHFFSKIVMELGILIYFKFVQE